MIHSPDAGLAHRPSRAVIGLGGNIGSVLATLNGAIAALDQTPGIAVTACSSWYQSHPVGPPQPDFINGCALLEVSLSPQALLQSLLAIEQQYGRIRKERWGPRTLDLDLIFYENHQLNLPNLQIPHPQFHLRPFVLIPLAEIAPNWVDPQNGQAIRELLRKMDKNAVWKIAPAASNLHHQPINSTEVLAG
ncbi:MAG: 2-amino-4-hydroxy-6-hydroxymethyldihydropteridine diphosphokinase [Synechocystis sp.]